MRYPHRDGWSAEINLRIRRRRHHRQRPFLPIGSRLDRVGVQARLHIKGIPLLARDRMRPAIDWRVNILPHRLLFRRRKRLIHRPHKPAAGSLPGVLHKSLNGSNIVSQTAARSQRVVERIGFRLGVGSRRRWCRWRPRRQSRQRSALQRPRAKDRLTARRQRPHHLQRQHPGRQIASRRRPIVDAGQCSIPLSPLLRRQGCGKVC